MTRADLDMYRLITLIFLMGPGPVLSQTLPGAEFGLSFGTNLERSENFKRAESAFDINLGGDLSLQFDLAISKYQTAETITPSGGVHLVWSIDQDTRFGAFVVGETPDDETTVAVGIEAATRSGPFTMEGFAAATAPVNSNDRGARYGIDISYDLGTNANIALLAGHHGDDFDGDTRSFSYIGTQWTVSDRVELDARLGQTDQGDGVVTLGITLRTDGTSRFQHRDIFAALPGY